MNDEKEDGVPSDASDEEAHSRSRSVSGTPMLGSSALGSDTEEEEEKRDEKHEQRESSVDEGEDGFEVSRFFFFSSFSLHLELTLSLFSGFIVIQMDI